LLDLRRCRSRAWWLGTPAIWGEDWRETTLKSACDVINHS
jgi:hypothetical protein